MLLALVAGGYLAWVFVPVYMVHLEVKQVVRDFGNRAVKERDDDALVRGMTERLRRLAVVQEPGEDGAVVVRPAVELAPQDVTWERLEGDRLHVAFAYQRTIPLPIVERRAERTLSVDLTLDVARPVWENLK
jgi:hypothetical protein